MRESGSCPATDFRTRDVKHRILYKVVQRGAGSTQLQPAQDPNRCSLPAVKTLRNEKNLLRVRIFNFGSRRETSHIHVALIRSVRTGDETGFARNWNSIGNVAFGRLDRCRGRFRRRSWRLFSCIVIRRRRRWIIGIERLLPRRIFAAYRCGISCDVSPRAHWRFIIVGAG